MSSRLWEAPYLFDHDYLSAVLKEGSGQTGVFGLRLMWESLSELSTRLGVLYPGRADDHDRFEAAFGPCVYVYLRRKDKVAQAVSRLRAEHTGLWHIFADGSERERLTSGNEPEYDRSRLQSIIDELQAHEAAWLNWYVRHGVSP